MSSWPVCYHSVYPPQMRIVNKESVTILAGGQNQEQEGLVLIVMHPGWSSSMFVPLFFSARESHEFFTDKCKSKHSKLTGQSVNLIGILTMVRLWSILNITPWFWFSLIEKTSIILTPVGLRSKKPFSVHERNSQSLKYPYRPSSMSMCLCHTESFDINTQKCRILCCWLICIGLNEKQKRSIVSRCILVRLFSRLILEGSVTSQ